ncbi:hypothetical protein DPMN_052631 [Dreissena polymorpha]|uniref:Uncharacterized protein n=1 Tax=Dreissena polymorpha TaxID=45954 RepID=A0A9D4HN66_DREPO|nr:hypothetical protein DPMN_052631 [Dreissena polymorpha]
MRINFLFAWKTEHPKSDQVAFYCSENDEKAPVSVRVPCKLHHWSKHTKSDTDT